MPSSAGRLTRSLSLAVLLVGSATLAAQQALPAPETVLGFPPGADRSLATWDQITGYLDSLAGRADRLRILELGQTTMGRRLIAVMISSPENLAAADRYRDIVRRLADPRRTDPATAARLAEEGKVFVTIGASIHASEVGAAQMMPRLVYHLATDDSRRTREILDNAIVLLLPSLNPDGLDLVADWYRSSLDTAWEGASMPWLYNKYVGHDINRDFFMLTQTENRHLARLQYEDWQPQVFLTMHQMGPNGPRMFVPPNYEPVDPNYEPLIWRQAGLLGHAMATELEAQRDAGVITNAMYDYFFPGYEDSGPLGHNTVCLLSETASVRTATPVTLAYDELSGTSKGLPDYRIQQNFPDPWPGGTWRLRDIVDYDFAAALGLLDATAKFRVELLHNFYRMGARQVQKGRTESPAAFVVPAAQRDPLTAVKLIDILRLGRIEVSRATKPFEADGRTYGPGTYVISMAQPFRAYAKTLLERQTYPARRLYEGGSLERPYDVTGWTLPLQMGVEAVAVEHAFDFAGEPVMTGTPPPPAPIAAGARAVALSPALNDSFLAVNRLLATGRAVLRTTAPISVDALRLAAGSFVVPIGDARDVPEPIRDLSLPATSLTQLPDPGRLVELRTPRVGLYKPWTASIDEGWTRWLLEQYEFPFVSLEDAEIRSGRLGDRFDVIVLPSIRNAPERIVEGNEPGSTAPAYVGGIGTEGVRHLREFVEQGGTLVALDASTLFAIEALDLPVRNVLDGLSPDEFFCPGSILRTVVDPDHPVAYGMPAESIAVFASSPAFALKGAPGARIVASYPESEILLSGWLEGADRLAGAAAAVDVPLGAGRVLLFGFGVQQRAQPHATFKMLFNALGYGVVDQDAANESEPATVEVPRPRP